MRERPLLFDSAQEAAFPGGIRSFVTVIGTETGHYCADMVLGSLGGNEELFSDLASGQSLGQERENL